MNVGSPLVTDAKAAELIEPGECSLHYPAPSPQSAAVLGVAHRQQRQDAAVAQTLPDRSAS
jgi:hypothetical protein